MARKIDDAFLSDIARQYAEHVAAGAMPAPAIATAEGVPVRTAQRWVYVARKRGIIPPSTQGLASGSTPKRPLGPVGQNVQRNVQRLRAQRRMTFVELSGHLDTLARPIPVLGLRRIETGTRRVDVDDLAALAAVFDVTPVYLLEPPPGCETCQGAPPPGFACTACGSSTATKES